MENNPPRTSSFGPLKDLHNLQQNGSASLSELKEFLTKLQGRSPQEVVGIVSTSLLVQSMALATVGTLALLAVFTIGPYLVYGAPQPKAKAAAPVAAVAPATNDAPASAPASSAAQPTTSGEPSTDDKTKALQKMGIDETKTADPQVNPLEKNLDNLLDNVK
jgi:hypothetical protein